MLSVLQPRAKTLLLPDDWPLRATPRPQLLSIALRYVTEIPPCQEADIPKVSTHSATPNARHAIVLAARLRGRRPSSAIGGLSTSAPARSAGRTRSLDCSPCKPNTP